MNMSNSFVKQWLVPLAVCLLLFAAACYYMCRWCWAGPQGAGQHALMEHPYVCKEEFLCMEPEFDKHFTTGSGVIKDHDKLMEWGALESLFTTPAPTGTEYGIRFHYGLSGSGPHILELGVEVVTLKPRTNMFYDVTPSGTIYLLQAGGSLGTQYNEADWDTNFGDLYFSQVKVKRAYDDANPDRVTKAYDHASYTFRRSHLKSQHLQNGEPAYLRIYSLGDPLIRKTDHEEDDWRHVLAIVSATSTSSSSVLLDNTDYGADIFKSKALDLGSPCPPSCVVARFYRYGLAPRSKCKC